MGSGNVVTFYSYKGGVGRSFTLANVAILLARWGYRVLAVDWDLEAPGLHLYFAPLLACPPATGVVDLVDDFTAGVVRPAAGHATPLDLDERGAVHLLAAGQQDERYVARVQGIDWDGLYERGFADFLERCRAEWVTDFDFVLIDSRTGITDTGGICTAHLPDRLVIVFTANEQSVRGAVDIAHRANRARDRLPYDRGPLVVLPILSRLDGRVEYERAERWHARCVEQVAPLYRGWLMRNVPEELMLRHTTVPYVSYWSFGEQLPVQEERTPSADQVSFALETVAAVVAHQFDRTDVLADNRDAYVAASRAAGRTFELDIVVSSPRSALPFAKQLVSELRALGVRADGSLSGDLDRLDQVTDQARHLCVVVDGVVSRWQQSEAERFLRSTLGAAEDRRLFPVLTRTVAADDLPVFLRNLQHLEFGAGMRLRDVARALRDYLTGNGSGPSADEGDHAYRAAASALRHMPDRLPYRSRWDLIDETVRTMSEALDSGDVELLRDLTLDLELAGGVHASGSRFETPDALKRAVARLLDRLDRRIRVSSN